MQRRSLEPLPRECAQGDFVTRLIAALNQVEGAYSLTCIAKDTIIAVRDPRGVRPLVLAVTLWVFISAVSLVVVRATIG